MAAASFCAYDGRCHEMFCWNPPEKWKSPNMYSCHFQTMRWQGIHKKCFVRKVERKIWDYLLWDWRVFPLLRTTNKPDKFRISDIFRRKQENYKTNLIFTISHKILTRNTRTRKSNSIPVMINPHKKHSRKSIAKDCFAHVHIIMCFCHIFCPFSKAPRRWFIEPENFKSLVRRKNLFERFCWFFIWFSVAYVGWKLQAFIMRHKVVRKGERQKLMLWFLKYTFFTFFTDLFVMFFIEVDEILFSSRSLFSLIESNQPLWRVNPRIIDTN